MTHPFVDHGPDGVVYMLTGTDHQEMLVVSLMTLRRHWQGPVHIIAGCDESATVAVDCMLDPRLNCDDGPVSMCRWAAPRGRNRGYLNKTKLVEMSPFDQTVFLDADTLVVGDIGEVFPKVDEMVLTTFGKWTTQSRIVKARLERWVEVEPALAPEVICSNAPAINTGVMGFSHSPDCVRWGEDWKATTNKLVTFICDEVAAQLIVPRNNVRLLDHRWNASVVYSMGLLGLEGDEAPRVWHGHGGKFFRKDAGWHLWLPEFNRAMALDIGKVNSRPITNPYLIQRMA